MIGQMWGFDKISFSQCSTTKAHSQKRTSACQIWKFWVFIFISCIQPLWNIWFCSTQCCVWCVFNCHHFCKWLCNQKFDAKELWQKSTIIILQWKTLKNSTNWLTFCTIDANIIVAANSLQLTLMYLNLIWMWSWQFQYFFTWSCAFGFCGQSLLFCQEPRDLQDVKNSFYFIKIAGKASPIPTKPQGATSGRTVPCRKRSPYYHGDHIWTNNNVSELLRHNKQVKLYTYIYLRSSFTIGPCVVWGRIMKNGANPIEDYAESFFAKICILTCHFSSSTAQLLFLTRVT